MALISQSEVTERELKEIMDQIKKVEMLLQKDKKITDASRTKDGVDSEQKEDSKQREDGMVSGDSTRKIECVNRPRTDYGNVADSIHDQECPSDMVEHGKEGGRAKKKEKSMKTETKTNMKTTETKTETDMNNKIA